MRRASAWSSPLGKVAPRRIQPGDVAAAPGKHARHAGHHGRAGGAGNIRESGHGGGGHAEERHEHRALRPEVEVGQVVVERRPTRSTSIPFLMPAWRGNIRPPKRVRPASRRASNTRVLLPRVHHRHRELERQARSVASKPTKCGANTMVFACALQVLAGLRGAPGRCDALARRPPQDALLDERAAEGAEVRAREALALARAHSAESTSPRLMRVTLRRSGISQNSDGADRVPMRGKNAATAGSAPATRRRRRGGSWSGLRLRAARGLVAVVAPEVLPGHSRTRSSSARLSRRAGAFAGERPADRGRITMLVAGAARQPLARTRESRPRRRAARASARASRCRRAGRRTRPIRPRPRRAPGRAGSRPPRARLSAANSSRTPAKSAGTRRTPPRPRPSRISGSSQRDLRRAVEHGDRHVQRGVLRRDLEAAHVRREEEQRLALRRARRPPPARCPRLRCTSAATLLLRPQPHRRRLGEHAAPRWRSPRAACAHRDSRRCARFSRRCLR